MFSLSKNLKRKSGEILYCNVWTLKTLNYSIVADRDNSNNY